jgi:hypothetical protein
MNSESNLNTNKVERIEEKAKIQISISLAGMQSGSSGNMTSNFKGVHNCHNENVISKQLDNQDQEEFNSYSIIKGSQVPNL